MTPSEPLVDRWAASGAMALTGRADGPPLRAPAAVVARLNALQAEVGDRLGLDGAALLGERAACAGFTRQGAVSCGGATRLLRAADGWVAPALARPDDVAAVEAWLGVVVDQDDPWPAVAAAVASRPAVELAELGQLLALPVAALGHGPERPAVVPRQLGRGRLSPLGTGRLSPLGRSGLSRSPAGAVVVDLSSLWAGPLCAHLLQLGGAAVVKVESRARPDGARAGSPAFFDLLHAGQRAVALDFRRREDIGVLVELLQSADVVIEGSRPRALEQLGIGVDAVAAAGRLAAWVSVTAYGRAEDWRDRVGFGDDAAVAAGLVAWEDATPVFCADAVADPLTGLTAAAAVHEALAEGGQWLLDVSLHACARAAQGSAARAGAGAGSDEGAAVGTVGGAGAGARGLAGTVGAAGGGDAAGCGRGGVADRSWPPGTEAEAVPPRARPARGPAPALGADTSAVLAALVGGRR